MQLRGSMSYWFGDLKRHVSVIGFTEQNAVRDSVAASHEFYVWLLLKTFVKRLSHNASRAISKSLCQA